MNDVAKLYKPSEYSDYHLDKNLDSLLRTHNLTINSICDYKVRSFMLFYRELTIYIADDSSGLIDWCKVAKVRLTNIRPFKARAFQQTLKLAKSQKRKYDLMGHREGRWFFRHGHIKHKESELSVMGSVG